MAIVRLGAETILKQIETVGPGTRTYTDALSSLGEMGYRDQFIEKYSWGVPSREALKAIALFARKHHVLEIGAGNGLWAKLLTAEGVSIVATDAKDLRRGGTYKPDWPQYFKVERLASADAVKKYTDCNVLLTVWPTMGDMAYEALREFKGHKVVYVGEWEGCTGGERFEKLLTAGWQTSRPVPVPNWPGMHDKCYLFTRKAKSRVKLVPPTAPKQSAAEEVIYATLGA